MIQQIVFPSYIDNSQKIKPSVEISGWLFGSDKWHQNQISPFPSHDSFNPLLIEFSIFSPDMPVMSILGRFLALRTTTVSLAAAGWWQTDTSSSPRPWSFS